MTAEYGSRSVPRVGGALRSAEGWFGAGVVVVVVVVVEVVK